MADGAMTAAGFDIDGGHGLDRDAMSVKFEVTLAFQNNVDFGGSFVIVGACVLLNIHKMETCRVLGRGSEGASAESARARDRGHLIKLSDKIIGHGNRTEGRDRGNR